MDPISSSSSNRSRSRSSTSNNFITRFCGKYLSSSSHSPPLINILPKPKQHNHDHTQLHSTTVDQLELELQQQVFTYFDEDGDGKISAAELQSCFRTVGVDLLSNDDAQKAVRTSDDDGDGTLGFHDFAKLMQTTPQDGDKELREAFEMYSSPDTAAGDGDETYITPKSLNKMLSRLGLGLGQSTTISNCKTMIRHFDLNGDGLLNFDEFRIMMS